MRCRARCRGYLAAYITLALLVAGFIVPVPTGVGLDSGTADAAIIVVDKGGGGDYTHIQDAIDAASPGDTIKVNPGTYKQQIYINKTLTVTGSSMENTTIDGGAKWQNGVTIQAKGVEFSNFTVTNSGVSNTLSAAIMVRGFNDCHLLG